MFEPKDIMTLIIALAGLLLGIVNYVRAVNADRVILKIIPKLSWVMGESVYQGILSVTGRENINQNIKMHGPPLVAIEVINMGKIPVTIDEIGFCVKSPRKGPRSVVPIPLILGKAEWPTKLEPRKSQTYRVSDFSLQGFSARKVRVYAGTECGVHVTGSSEAFEVWCEVLHSNRESETA